MNYVGFYDGSASPNPGAIGLGVSLFLGKREILCGAAPGGIGTNNAAEYMALIWLLEIAIEAGVKCLVVYGDSQLITNQVNGKWSVGSETLKTYHTHVLNLINSFDSVGFEWIKREKNKRADALSKRGSQLTSAKLHKKDVATTEGEKVVETSKCEVVHLRVKATGNGCFSILELGKPVVVLNTFTMKCTCSHYLNIADCVHMQSFKRCKTSL